MHDEHDPAVDTAEPPPTRFGRERPPAPKQGGRLTGAGAPPEQETSWLDEQDDGDGL
jgi:hypothetical protein